MTARVKANLLAAAMAAGAGVLYFFPPGEHSFYPQCPFYRLTHLYCPGCGATRALAALLHGRLLEAAHFNLFVVALAPIALGYFATWYWNTMKGNRWDWPQVPVPVLQYLVCLAALFTAGRNIFQGSL